MFKTIIFSFKWLLIIMNNENYFPKGQCIWSFKSLKKKKNLQQSPWNLIFILTRIRLTLFRFQLMWSSYCNVITKWWQEIISTAFIFTCLPRWHSLMLWRVSFSFPGSASASVRQEHSCSLQASLESMWLWMPEVDLWCWMDSSFRNHAH